MQADLNMPTTTSSSEEEHLAAVVKRKRTKRPRHHMQMHPPASPSASSSESTTTEEEDMAHCLILLAQGQGAAVDSNPSPPLAPMMQPRSSPPAAAPPPPPAVAVVKAERYTSRKYTEAAATADGARAGFYVYECKTCNKCFPTFQALGGHRASHKKPRLAAAEDDSASASATSGTIAKPKPPIMKSASPPPPIMTAPSPSPRQVESPAPATAPVDVATALSLHNGGGINKLRVHECSVCGAEFASGQALGGHMRRHRPLNPPERAVTAITADTKKEGNACASINLELDLNLPAPSDEESVSLPPPPAMMLGLSQFNGGNKVKGRLMLTTPAALVDCHY